MKQTYLLIISLLLGYNVWAENPTNQDTSCLVKPLVVKVTSVKQQRNILLNKIDSLLDLPDVPFDLVSDLLDKINRLRNPYKIPVEENWSICHFSDTVYQEWNIDKANPYSKALKAYTLDSTLELNLGKFSPPIKGPITSRFGWRDGKPHKGIDLDLRVRDTLVAAFDGVVRLAKYYGGYGRAIIIRHDNGLETIYAHLHRIRVKVGQRVNSGDFIGLGGNSGHSTGSHLHFETRFLGMPVNPEIFIDFDSCRLVYNEITLKKTKYSFACFPKGAEFHTVKSGDFLYKISSQYGVSIQQLCKLNRISRNKTLIVGDKLRII